jgi:hypothetical protein
MKWRELSKHGLVWGLLLGFAISASIQVLTWLGLGLTYWTWLATYLAVVVLVALSGRSLTARWQARPNLKQAAVLVVVMILVAKVIYQIYMFTYINFVDSNWVEMVAEVWQAQMQESGVSDENIAAYIADFRRQWETSYVFTLGLVSHTLPQFVLGFVSIVVAVVQPWKKRRAA